LEPDKQLEGISPTEGKKEFDVLRGPHNATLPYQS